MNSTNSHPAFPTTFNVGNQQTEPFVVVAELMGHLTLLNQFMQLRLQVDGMSEELPGMPRDGDNRRIWFVGLAVER